MKYLVFLLLPLSAAAEVSIGPIYSVYNSERLKSEVGYTLKAGRDTYIWGSYENPSVQLVGQNMGKVKMWGAGLGVKKDFGRVSVFGEFGYFMPEDPTTKDSIRNEAVEQALANDHGSEKGLGQRMPWHPQHTVYKLSADYGGRVGASYQLSPHSSVSLSYRALKLNEGLDACTGDDPSCDYPVDGRHWQNRKTLDLSSVEFGISVRF